MRMEQPFSLSTMLTILEEHRSDPRIAKDLAVIDRHLLRLERPEMARPSMYAAVARDQRRRRQAALRIIGQRATQAVKRLKLTEV